MSEQRDRFPVVTRRSMAGFFTMIAVFGVIYLVFLAPAVLGGLGVLDEEQGTRLEKAYDDVRAAGWFSPALFVLIAFNFVFLVRQITPRRRELLWTGDRFVIEGREYTLPDRPARPGKWSHSYAGTLGVALALCDAAGKQFILGLKDVLCAENQYGPLLAEECDFYLEKKADARQFLDQLQEAKLLELPDEPHDAWSGGDRAPLRLTLNQSVSGFKTWWPFFVGFFVGMYALVGLAMLLRKLSGSDAVAYAVTLIGAFAMIVGAVVYSTKRLRRKDLRLEIDLDQLTLQKTSGKVVVRRRLGELTFATPAWTSYARYAGHFYVGPQLEVLVDGESLFRLGTMDPHIRWAAPTRDLNTCDYVLGPPEWRRVVERLGLTDRLQNFADASDA